MLLRESSNVSNQQTDNSLIDTSSLNQWNEKKGANELSKKLKPGFI